MPGAEQDPRTCTDALSRRASRIAQPGEELTMGLSEGQSPTTPVAEKHYAEPPRAVAVWRQDGGTLVLVVEPVSTSAAPTAPRQFAADALADRCAGW